MPSACSEEKNLLFPGCKGVWSDRSVLIPEEDSLLVGFNPSWAGGKRLIAWGEAFIWSTDGSDDWDIVGRIRQNEKMGYFFTALLFLIYYSQWQQCWAASRKKTEWQFPFPQPIPGADASGKISSWSSFAKAVLVWTAWKIKCFQPGWRPPYEISWISFFFFFFWDGETSKDWK